MNRGKRCSCVRRRRAGEKKRTKRSERKGEYGRRLANKEDEVQVQVQEEGRARARTAAGEGAGTVGIWT
eukprot:331373-Hanusia_phi.AAC.1